MGNGPHPVLILGIIIFVLPYLSMALPWFNLPTWLMYIGIAVILIGALLSMFRD